MQEGYQVGDYVDDGSPQFPQPETYEDGSIEIIEEETPVAEPEEQVYEQEPDQQEEEQPEPEEEEPRPEKKKTRIGERLSQVQRERYEALEEANRLRVENERLRSLANMSTQTALEHYDKSLIHKIQVAKENKIKALENGDIQAQVDADMQLGLATSEYQNLMNMKAQHGYQRQQGYEEPQYQQHHQQPQQQPQPQLSQVLIQDWAQANPWFNPNSDSYDDEMAAQVEHYCTALDNNLYRTGRQHEIMSPQYFEAVDYYVNQLRAQRPRQAQRGGELNMRPARNTVSPVRGSGVQSSGGGQTKIRLTKDEVDMARAYGITPEVFAQYKMKDIREGKDQRGRR